MGGNKLKSIEVLNTYIEGSSVAIPTWLKHLIEAEEIHQNYENIQVLGASSSVSSRKMSRSVFKIGNMLSLYFF